MNIDDVLQTINDDFTGKAVDDRGECVYKTCNGDKCIVGLFLPEGHLAQNESDMSVGGLLTKYPELIKLMPTKDAGILGKLQTIHDSSFRNDISTLSLEEQKMYLMLHSLRLLGDDK